MSAEPARLQLGELLVHKGVLTEAQLEIALAEQQTSGAPLGEILVRLGFSQGPTIANALAEQHGGPLRTEYGLSLGPTTAAPKPLAELPSAREAKSATLRLNAALEEKSKELARVSAELTTALERVAAANAELARARLAPSLPPPADRHVLFVPGSEGYTMVDQTGPVPAVGTVIQYGGAIYEVRNAGESTLLGIPINCALLAPA